MTKLLMMD